MKKPEGKNIKSQVGVNGTEYVYEDKPYWDKDKKQNRHKRIYLGKMNTDGEFIPNKRYLASLQVLEEKSTPITSGRVYWGATHLLDEIGRITGVTADIESGIPLMGSEMLSLAYYLVIGKRTLRLYRF